VIVTETAFPLTSPVLLFWCATKQQFVYSAVWTAEIVAGLYVMQFVCPLCREWQVEMESDVPAIARHKENAAGAKTATLSDHRKGTNLMDSVLRPSAMSSRLTVINCTRRISFVEDEMTGECFTVWYGSQCSCQESMCLHSELVMIELAGEREHCYR
jgi:hypothetical protein